MFLSNNFPIDIDIHVPFISAIIYSTAKETRKLVTFKLFNMYDPRILIYIWSKLLCNERSLSMTSGYFLSTVAQNGYYQAELVLSNFEKQLKTIEFSEPCFQILCLIWLIKGQWISILSQILRCKISRLWRKMRFCYTQSLSKPEVSEIKKQIRKRTKINAASNTAKPFIRTWKL